MQTWQGIEVRYLAALAMIRDAGSFNSAADRLGYAQSAVSQQIARLEAIVGTRLIERESGHAKLAFTEAGEVLLAHADRILWQLSAAAADLRSQTSDDSATLRIGVYGSLASRLVPATVALMSARHPEVHLEFVEDQVDQGLFERVERSELDVAFGELPLPRGPFEARPVLVDPLELLLPTGSELAQRGECPSLAEIASLDLISSPGWRLERLLEAELRSTGVDPSFPRQAATAELTHALVRAGLGAAIRPRLAINHSDPGTASVSLAGLLPPRRIVLYRQRNRRRTESLDAFEQAVQGASERVARDRDWNESPQLQRAAA